MSNRKWTCFNCRKTYNREHARCPHCGNEVNFMGKYFKPPKSNKDKEWEAIELLIKGGFQFSAMTGEVPRHPRDVPEFLEQDYIKRWLEIWNRHKA